MPDFRLQPNSFPIASVIDAAQRNNALQEQARQAGNQSLIQGLQSIGQIGQSLYDTKMRVAQALAQKEIFKKTHPELFATTQTTTTQSPVSRNQTAAYDPASGAVTPNTNMSGVGAVIPQTRTVAVKPAIDDQTALNAFMGMTPKDFFDNLSQSNAQKISAGDLALKQQTEPQRIATEARRAAAEEENNKMQRLWQGLLANNTIQNNAREREQASEKEAMDSSKAILAAGSPLNPFNPVTFAQKRAALKTLSGEGKKSGWTYVGKVGQQ